VTEFDFYQSEIEADLGRPVDQGEALVLKAVYYFGKGLQLLRLCELETENVGNKQIG
jgi:hypothetical protein